MARLKRRRILIGTIVALLFVAGIVTVVASSRVGLPAKPDQIPLAIVKRGEIDLKVHASGELHASHAIMLSAPAVGGDSLQITHLAQAQTA